KVNLEDGCSEPAYDSFFVSVPDPPKADFEASPAKVVYGRPVYFTNLSQNGTRTDWSFGDPAGHSTDWSPVYTYADSGDYKVRLIVWNQSGCSDTALKTLHI